MPKYYFKSAFTIAFFCVFLRGSLSAQKIGENYPVTANAFITAQSSQRLSEYFQNSAALKVDLLLKDLTKPTLQVYLKFSLEGAGIRIFTQDGYVPSNFILLQKGSVNTLHGTDLLANYFRPEALSAEGIDKASIFNANLLPTFLLICCLTTEFSYQWMEKAELLIIFLLSDFGVRSNMKIFTCGLMPTAGN